MPQLPVEPPVQMCHDDIPSGERIVALRFRNVKHMEQWVKEQQDIGYKQGLEKGAEEFKNRIKGIIKELT